jgi:glycosyltransferase involved in cell wall biosynthesis/tetratricopeptide (TPR) repeat protein
MNRSEINKLLYEIREKCNKDNAEEYLISIQDIFQIKPVTMLFFNVKAKLLCEIGRYEEAIDLLTVTVNLILPEQEHIETCKLYQRAFIAIGKDTLYKQWSCMENYIRYILNEDESSFKNVQEIENNINKIQNAFLDSLQHKQTEMELANAYYESWYSVEGTILYALSLKGSNVDYKNGSFYKDRIAFETNHTFLFEQLLNKESTYVLLTNSDDYAKTMVIGKALTKMNNKVYVIMPAVSAKVEYQVDLNETVKISKDNIEVDRDGITKIRPLEVVLEEEVIGNNSALLIDNLTKETEEDFSIVLGTAQIFTNVNDMPEARKRMQRLSQFRGDLLEAGFAFGYFGSYTSYLSKIYSLDVKEEINKPSECEFSIVIPVRNSAESLRYTLQTCLEQRGMDDNSYEIVVSDNSYPEYMEVETLIKELNNPKIKYYRTPRQLTLSRSFEYAFIRSKGDFVFSIGADDAVLPWGLEVLRKTLKQRPDDILQWDRGFFVWPNNDKASSQAGQFVIPRNYNKENINITKINATEYLVKVLNNPSLIYGMPMLYINSGCRRRYFHKMLKDTGRLWDGITQDLYMGIVNLTINETINYLQYPITIAGMTSNSVGLTESKFGFTIKQMLKKIVEGSDCGISVIYGKGLNFLYVNLDIAFLYCVFYRVANIDESGKLDLISSKINWKEIFKNMAIKYHCDDLRFDYNIKLLRYSAYCHGNEFGKWFDDNILEYIITPRAIIHSDKRIYSEGFLPGGGLQLDARKFDVKNVHEATKLFEDICNL